MKSFSKFLVILIAVGCFSIPGRAQDQQESTTLQDAINGYESVTNGPAGLPTDWSSRYLIFSTPEPGSDAEDKVQQDPRYWMQQIRRAQPLEEAVAEKHKKKDKKDKDPKPKKPNVTRDWAFSLGTGGIAQNMYPAKFDFYPGATPSCTNDYVAYGLNVAGSTGHQANLVALNNLYSGATSGVFSGESFAGSTLTFDVNGTDYTFTATTGTTAANEYAQSTNVSTQATHLVTAIGDTAGISAAVTAVANTPTAGEVSLTGTAAGTTITVTEGGTGSTQFGNYFAATCATTPTVFWAYNATNHSGTVTTSPTLSYDPTGSEVIYVESVTGGPSYLHVLKWVSGQGTPTTSAAPTNSETNVGSCPASASCLVSIELLGSSITSGAVTSSSPFYNYGTDTLFVGDNNGNLFKVTPLLGSTSGSPPVVTAVNLVTAGTNTSVLTPPVYDSVTGFVFVGSNGGNLYAVTASSMVKAGTLQVGNATCSGGFNRALTDAPIVDSSNGWVYEYTTDNTSDDTAVVQATTAGPFTTTHVVEVGVGDSNCNDSEAFRTHAPDFDNTYYTGTVTSGHMWVCGRSTTNGAAELWYIPTSGTGGAMTTTPGLQTGITQISSTDHSECSPITEFYNSTSSTDYIFFGEGLAASYANLYGYNITTANASTQITPVTGYPDADFNGGTSAPVIDNYSSDNEASSIYFTLLNPATSTATCGTSGAYCAIKLTQSGLGS